MSVTLVSVHQPNFMPWLKLLDKVLASDVFVAYDTVQYTKTEYHARQKIRAHHGTAWLSVPVKHVKGAQQMIEEVELDNSQPFRKRHRTLLRASYQKAPYFDEVYSLIEKVYARDHERLVDLNIDLIEALCSYLDTPVRIIRASTLPHQGSRAERLVHLVRAVGGDVHLTSTYGGEHQDVDWQPFAGTGIALRSQEFDHPEYDQIGDDFVPHLAAVDMLFMCGPATAGILAERRRMVPVDPAADRQDRGD